MIKDINIPKIDFNSVYLQNICKKYILFKYTCKGIKFLSIEKETIVSPTELDLKKVYNIFNSFTIPMYETLLEDRPTKIYLDLDFNDITCTVYNQKENIFTKFDNYLKNFLRNKNIDYTNISYMDASRAIKKSNNLIYKLSLHVTVNGVGFRNRKILKYLIYEFKKSLEKDTLIYNAIDMSIYNVPQLFKCVMSPSKDSDKLLIPFYIKYGNIYYLDNNSIIKNILNYLVGIYDDKYNYIDNNFDYLLNNDIKSIKINNNKKITKNYSKIMEKEIPKNTIKWLNNNYYIKDIYKLRNNFMKNNKIDLLRIKPAFCKICKRIHDNENAYCIVTENNIFFNCGRNKSNGVLIGSWYNNFNKKEKLNYDNNLLNQNKILKKTINDLKSYIKDIEDKYNEAVHKLDIISKNICNNILKKIHQV